MNLNSPISTGARSLKMYSGRLEKLGIFTFEDFLFHLPSRYEDYSLISKIGQIQPQETVTIKGKVLDIKNQYMRGARIKTIQKATITDDTGSIELVWFNQPFLIKTLEKDSNVSISGRAERSKKGFSITSPDYEVLYKENSNPLHTGRLVPVYPETKGISSKWLRRQIYNLLTQHDSELEEYLPEELIKNNNFPDFRSAIKTVHFPKSIDQASNAKARIAFDELFLLQLSSIKRRSDWNKKTKGHKFDLSKFQNNTDELISSLPFKLTNSQITAIDEILKDLSTDKPMNRLLQGDVGSGKTIVGAIALYLSYLNGFQSVLMAPTEILANQHFETISKLLSPLRVRVDLVTGSKKKYSSSEQSESSPLRQGYEGQGKSNSQMFLRPSEALAKEGRQARTINEDFDILIGTHAVLSEKIKFNNLGLVIIDEQQRFGVQQRGIIREKGTNPHLLTMTATPIPRTVALTMYGDLDLSYLSEMPQDRKVIKTWLVPPEKRNSAYEWIRKQIKETDSQAFVICPFIEESESMQTVKAANVEYEKLKKIVFPELKLGLLHGKLKAKEKEDILSKFRKGSFDILVATPVVEVGIDIPNATIIMIEAADRFGLAQLHQLRGRVGRSDKQSYCLLFTDNKNAQNSQRLKGMETLHSGAELSELDLKLRGHGNMYGTAQHGIPKLKAATFSDTELIQKARSAADKIFTKLSEYPRLMQKVENTSNQNISPD